MGSGENKKTLGSEGNLERESERQLDEGKYRT